MRRIAALALVTLLSTVTSVSAKDVVVIYTAIEPEQITDIRVLATVVGGQPVFQAADSPLRL